ncbi:MAG: hypothetical protein ACRD12_18330 [Acidimicrobiales bacterium]
MLTPSGPEAINVASLEAGESRELPKAHTVICTQAGAHTLTLTTSRP